MSFLQCMQNFRSVRFQFFYNPVAKIKKFFQTGYHKQISLIFAFCMQINKQIDYRHNKKTSCPQITSQQNCPDQAKSQQSLQKIQYCTGNDQWVNFFRQEKRQITAFFPGAKKTKSSFPYSHRTAVSAYCACDGTESALPYTSGYD